MFNNETGLYEDVDWLWLGHRLHRHLSVRAGVQATGPGHRRRRPARQPQVEPGGQAGGRRRRALRPEAERAEAAVEGGQGPRPGLPSTAPSRPSISTSLCGLLGLGATGPPPCSTASCRGSSTRSWTGSCRMRWRCEQEKQQGWWACTSFANWAVQGVTSAPRRSWTGMASYPPVATSANIKVGRYEHPRAAASGAGREQPRGGRLGAWATLGWTPRGFSFWSTAAAWPTGGTPLSRHL
jgi:hypothetical protein